MRALLIATILVATIALASAQTLPRAAVKPGDKAPGFALINADGKVVTLDEYVSRGSLVLIFYRGYW